jgi:hypothetical protein
MLDIAFGTSINTQNRVSSAIVESQKFDIGEEILKDILNTEKETQERFKKRINIKDYNVTGKEFTDEELKKLRDELKHQEVIEWISAKIPQQYTETYIVIRRKSYIANMVQEIENMSQALKDKDQSSLDMYLSVFTNEINTIYKNFIHTGQDEVFLTIVNLFEDILCNKKLMDKSVLKESSHLLKGIKDKDGIEYSDYEAMLGRFFDKGIDVINIKTDNDET